MAPRSSARLLASSSSTPAPAPPTNIPPVAQAVQTAPPQLLELRKQWKWAALSQFYSTFAPLIALEDVALVDIENDLVESTMVVIPRVMQRLLTTLSNDRKITTENWQSALRRQYLRRDPIANPIGVEPIVPKQSRATTVASEYDEREQEDHQDDTAKTNGHVSDVKPEEEDERLSNAEEREAKDEKDKMECVADEKSADPGTKNIDNKPSENNVRDELKDWVDLSMLDKLDSMHIVTEWHFQNPLRLRQLMRSDDETASWRIEPIGFDSKRNAYWYIGIDRLWIQREPPKKPTKKSAKRKAKHAPSPRKAKVARLSKTGTKTGTKEKLKRVDRSNRSTPSVSFSTSNGQKKTAKTQRSSRQEELIDEAPTTPGSAGRARAAKTQANVKLDLQARQLLAAKAEFESLSRRSSRGSASRPLGTRISRRLHGDDDDDEWQQIPPEWLEGKDEPAPSLSKRPSRTSTRTTVRLTVRETPRKSHPVRRILSEEPDLGDSTGLEGDSDLTELSDSETSSRRVEDAGAMESEGVPDEEFEQKNEPEVSEPWPPADFVEWETICVSLSEWETIATRFEKATYHAEKALYKRLTQDIVPYVTEILREAEKQRQKEEALMNRKRSSRLAIRESEKETARQEALKRAEEEEKMSRIRRLEARTRREEEERNKREEERERRRKEREEREFARARRSEMFARDESEDESREEEKLTEKPVEKPPMDEKKGKEKGKSRTKTKDAAAANGNAPKANGRDKQATKAPRRQSKKAPKKDSGEDWELDCEICGAKGKNRDGDVPLMSCGKCGKWQHISCHDAADDRTGRKRRNWNDVDFFCQRCRSQLNTNGWQYEHPVLHPSSMTSSYLASSGLMPMNGQKTSSNYVYPNYPPRGVAAPSGQHSPSPRPSSNSIPSVTFAHYQPLQHGFASHPTHDPSQLYGSYNQSSVRDQIDPRIQSGVTPYYPQTASSNGIGMILPPTTTHPSLPQGPSSYQGHSQSHVQLPPIHQYKPSTSAPGAQPYYSP